MKPLQMLHTGNFNDLNQEWLADGSVIITLSKRGEDKVYRFRVRNLYQENEQEVDIDTGESISEESP